MVTIKDISNRLGVSISSVSKALNGATDISKKTRELIIETANEMGYIKKTNVYKENFKFGIIIDQNCKEYHKILNYDIINGFNSKALSERKEVLMLPLRESYKKNCLEYLFKSYNLDAAILLVNNISDTIRKSILKVEQPLIIINNYLSIDKHNVGYVGVDMVDGIRKVVTYLAEKGHEKISFINIKNNAIMYQDKLVGYIASLTSLGINYSYDSVLNISSFDYENEIINFFKKIRPTAICADNDFTAYKIINVLIKNGFNVPCDVSVVGFDDNFISDYSMPSISTVSYDKNELGVKAYMALNNILNGNNINRMQIKTEIIERESSKI